MRYDLPDLATQEEIKPKETGVYRLNIKDVEVRETKAGGPMGVLKFGFVDFPEQDDFPEYLWLPTENHDAQVAARQRVRVKRIKGVFGLDITEAGVDFADFAGRTGESRVIIEESDEFGDKNKIDPPPFE